MTVLTFVIHLLGATMLLLFAVRMVRTGIERAFGASFKRVITNTNNPFRSAATGLVLAVVLQSSAAVALLVAGFAGVGTLSFATGLSVVLGADLGSALLIQVLSYQIDWLVPVLLAVGGGLFIKTDRRKLKQAGRIVLGIAFILISLRYLRETMEPIRDSAFLPAIAGYLARDYVTAFLAGAALAFLMHSSIAVILMCVTLVAINAVPVEAGVSLVLGANLGSALIPIWLSRGMSVAARRVPIANLAIRGSGAVLALLIVNKLSVLSYLTSASPAQTLVNTHVVFNLLLLLVLPFCNALRPLFTSLMPDIENATQAVSIEKRTVLDEAALETPHLAISNLKREVLRMIQLIEAMFTPVMGIYLSGDKAHASQIIAEDQHVNTALDGIRHYAAMMPSNEMEKNERDSIQELAEYAISLESAGDVIVKRLIPRAMQKAKESVEFSSAGQDELINMYERVLANIALAANVLISDDLESARLLLEEKSEMVRIERNSRKKHLKRLDGGALTSFESSNIHLETLRALKDFNSQISAVAYPILYRSGQLLETRLISQMDDKIYRR